MSLQDASTLGCSHRRTNDCLSLLAGLSVSEDTYPSPSRSGSDSDRETRESPEILSKFKYC